MQGLLPDVDVQLPGQGRCNISCSVLHGDFIHYMGLRADQKSAKASRLDLDSVPGVDSDGIRDE